jgi:hypothetical protein
MELAAQFNVQRILNFVVLKGGILAYQQPGLVSSARMKEWLERAGAPPAPPAPAAAS